ncbi:helix-turn-helix transcriptional regulator [Haloarculaceae archaeon H-GB11]|nr:helix-turn-helix transcriptional regulator [Haloarculaceae archaeon H-GB11]
MAVLADGEQHGLGIKEELEQTFYADNVNHGRLYPNLDELVEKGLVAKGQRDRRTNNYELTQRGEHVLQRELEWLTDRMDAEIIGTVAGGDSR